jgi:hypothetical protein
VVDGREGLDGEGAGDLATDVTAHTVGDREQPWARIRRVLVVLAGTADIRSRGVANGNSHMCSDVVLGDAVHSADC